MTQLLAATIHELVDAIDVELAHRGGVRFEFTAYMSNHVSFLLDRNGLVANRAHSRTIQREHVALRTRETFRLDRG